MLCLWEILARETRDEAKRARQGEESTTGRK
nr:MAG TPA: hypothetical protein [Caudoviricetes sp.]